MYWTNELTGNPARTETTAALEAAITVLLAK